MVVVLEPVVMWEPQSLPLLLAISPGIAARTREEKTCSHSLVIRVSQG